MIEIKLQNLSKCFGDVAAVDGVTLTVPAGELFFLLGPSGCGKTTLLRLIAGFLEPDAGSIHFGGCRMNAVPAHRRNTGMVFQNYALWPHMTVVRNIRYGLDIRRIARAEKGRRVAEILSLVQMSGFEERFPAELSGGQQQRVALARALVVEPDVVLLDEPLSNLDAKLRLEMRAEIRRIHDRAPRTFVYVTHDQKEALGMADRIALMHEGAIVQVGTPEEVHRRPANLFCARFIGNCNTIPGAIRSFDDARVLVETELGTLAAQAGSQPLEVGAAAMIAVRPESLRSAPIAAAGPNTFNAKIASRMYLGEMVQYQLRAGSVELLATVLGSAESLGDAGKEVRLSFDANEALAFPPEA